VESPRIAVPDGDLEAARNARVEFVYRAGSARVEARVDLAAGDETPRRAGFAINGRSVERLVRASDYSLSFAAGARRADLPDPLRGVIRAFLTDLREGIGVSQRIREIAVRAALLQALADAAPGARR
jgi:hypothetical protein